MENNRLAQSRGERCHMKIALALSGGAARGAFHLGAIEALLEKDFQIEAISGSSIGALIGMSLSAGVAPREQLQIYKSKEFRKAMKFSGFKRGLFHIDMDAKILKKLIPVKNIENGNIDMYITTVDLYSGKIVRFCEGEAISLCSASISVVPLFEPVSYRDYQLVDGGIMDNLPIEPIQKYGVPIVGIDLHPKEVGFKNSIFGISKRSAFLMWRASVEDQIEVCDYYITNQKLKNYSLFSSKKLDELFEIGYQTVLNHSILECKDR